MEVFSIMGYYFELGLYLDFLWLFSYSFRVGFGYEINFVSYVNIFFVYVVFEGYRRLKELFKGIVLYGVYFKIFG